MSRCSRLPCLPPTPSTPQLGRQVPAMTLDPGSPGASPHLPLPPVSMQYQGHFRICVYQRTASSGSEFCSLGPPLGLSWGAGGGVLKVLKNFSHSNLLMLTTSLGENVGSPHLTGESQRSNQHAPEHRSQWSGGVWPLRPQSPRSLPRCG